MRRLSANVALVAEEINNITKRAGTAFIKFRIAAIAAAYCCKLAVLNIEKLGKSGARGGDVIGFVAAATALHTFITAHFRFPFSFLL